MNKAVFPSLSSEPPLRLEDLPDWMRPVKRRIDWGMLLVILLTLPVLGPLLTQPGLPAGTEAEVQVARGTEVATLLRSGILYSRWAPDFYNGLGSPIFNYIAPLPHNLVGFHIFMTDAQPVDSVKDFLCLSALLAGLGMYTFVSRRWSRWVGIMAALGYVYSAIITRQNADLAVLMSLALLPCCLWAMDESARHRNRRWHLLAIIVIALWSLCELRFTLLGFPVLFIAAATSPTRSQSLSILVWFLPLTAFFWLPAIAEQNDVIWVPTTMRRLTFYAITIPAFLELITPLAMAVFAGSAARMMQRPRYRIPGGALSILVIATLALLLSRTLSVEWINPFTHEMTEAQMGLYGSARDGLLLPASAYRTGMSPTDMIFQRTEVGRPERSALLPLGVSQIERQPLASRYAANLGTQQSTAFDRYYFPGWGVIVDGTGLLAMPDTQGLLTAEIPGDAREVYIWFGTTVPRILSWMITFAGILLCYIWLRRWKPQNSGAVFSKNTLDSGH